jgi:hypothetical protein
MLLIMLDRGLDSSGMETPTAPKIATNVGILLGQCRQKAAVISWSVKSPIKMSEGDFGRFW